MTITISNPDTGEISAELVRQANAVAVYQEPIPAREAIGAMLTGAVKPISAGGHQGLTFSEVSRMQVSNTLVVNCITHADWLAAPYPGSDAYVSDGHYMHAMVPTFDNSQLKFK